MSAPTLSDAAAHAGGTGPAGTTQAAQLDRIEARLAAIGDELTATRRDRDRWRELAHDLSPVTAGVMATATRELEDLSQDVTVDDLARFARTAVRVLPRLEALLGQLDSMADLAGEAAPLAGPVMAKVTDTLTLAESRGYVTFARGAAAIVDEVVASFGEEDLKALGANVVLILRTVQQMTQPEIMRFLSTTVAEVQEVDDAPPPSAVRLLRQMRDPQVRRGLSRTLTVLGDLGAATSADPRTRRRRARADAATADAAAGTTSATADTAAANAPHPTDSTTA